MPARKIIIPKLKDGYLIKCFKGFCEKLEGYECKVNVSLMSGDTISGTRHEVVNDKAFSGLNKSQGAVIYTIQLACPGFNITVSRAADNQQGVTPYSDSLTVNDSSAPTEFSEDLKIELLVEATRKLKSVGYFGEGRKDAFSEVLSLHDGALSRLENLNEELMVKTHQYKEDLDKQHKERISEVERILSEKAEVLEDQHRRKVEAVDKRKEEVERIKKEIDDKSNTHARRQIRKDIISEIKNRQTEFKLTEGTNKLRRPIAIGLLGLSAFLGFMAVIQYFQIESGLRGADGYTHIFLVLKQTLYSLGAVATIFFYIKWQNSWSNRHSDAEFQLKQLELDMERASWLVETCLEWKDVKGSRMPSELLEGLSRNLFYIESPNEKESILTPADQLASALLGSSSVVKLKSGDSELEIDPKKLRKAKAEGEANKSQ